MTVQADTNITDEVERQVVVMMTDMEQYSLKTATMGPLEIRDFLIEYHGTIHDIVDVVDTHPLDIEPSAGDGSLIIFDRFPGEEVSAVCNRALRAGVRMVQAIEDGELPPTRMGVLIGNIIEARIGNKIAKFGACFSIANRLEELCGYFGCHLLLDREVALKQNLYNDYLVNIGKVSITSVHHPMNIYSIYTPGMMNWPKVLGEKDLSTFIQLKNTAMENFSGNQLIGLIPDFPLVREKLLEAQEFYLAKVGVEDRATSQIVRYISENPEPDSDFNTHGMRMTEKKRDVFGERILHMSCGFLKAFDEDLYHALIEETSWERSFKLEWYRKGDEILKFGDIADGVYYLDSGTLRTINKDGEELSTIGEGSVFGEVAYLYSEKRRTATVIAETNVVLRRISTADLDKYPEIKTIFEAVARKKKEELPDIN